MDSYLIGHTNINDFDLKLCRVLKYSMHRKEVLELGVGAFLDSKTDALIRFPDFKPNGTPYQTKPKPTEKPKHLEPVFPAMKPKRKSRLTAIVETLKFLFGYENPFKKPQATRKGTRHEETLNEEIEREEREDEESLGLLGEPSEEW
jgi:hypothetical protein